MKREHRLALLLLSCASPVFAEDAMPEILVTARRISEDVSHLPLAIDVVSSADLGPGGIEGLDELAIHTPGLSFESLWGGSGSAPILRGLSQPSTAGDNVGVFVDDVYQSNRSALDVDMLDFERVEIIRGPQNTLFGRSTFAGAIRYVSAQPTATPLRQFQIEAGSDALLGARGVLSQRIGTSRWLGRLAASYREGEGTWRSLEGESLGGFRRGSLALSLATEQKSTDAGVIALNIRLGYAEYGHPASTPLNADDYNCGARTAGPGYWSYFCGNAPMDKSPSLTTDLPASDTRVAQAALRLEHSFGTVRLHSLTGYYHGTSTSYRDFDGSSQGLWSGVCSINISCTPGNPGAVVTRFYWPNVVSRAHRPVTDWSQELRLTGGSPAGLNWMLGLAGAWTDSADSGSFGADRGDLLSTERLSSIVASNPQQVGQPSPLNRALVADSRTEQVLQSQVLNTRKSFAAFGALDVPLTTRSRARLELRAETEKQRIDSRFAGFLPDTSADPEPVSFTEVTPRFSVDLAASEQWYGYASLARGARSGGANTLPGLDPAERTYEPEYNWTSELGALYTAPSKRASARVTVYRVDWRNAQIMGVATTPGVNSLITTNTAGILSRGIEASAQLRMGRLLIGSLAYSLADASFRDGSDDPGSRVFCGLTAQPPSSDFCTYGPSRSSTSNVALVPYLDGNRTQRAPRDSWNLSLKLQPWSLLPGWQASGNAALGCQGDVYERPINGASYGARCLLDGRAALEHGRWRFELWGANLTGERYIRVAGSRGANFYPSLPRPLDLLYGEGRRMGINIGFDMSGK